MGILNDLDLLEVITPTDIEHLCLLVHPMIKINKKKIELIIVKKMNPQQSKNRNSQQIIKTHKELKK